MGASGAVELMELRQQLEQLRQEKRAIEERLNAREQQSGQERSALEAEIEQLMERLMRLQRERSL
jgi:predicted  nucleic acid-binding Zn-ribbon protein